MSLAAELDEYRQHRKEVSYLSEVLAGGRLRFAARSYGELWVEWENAAKWHGMKRHVGRLRERYEFSV